MCKGGKQTTSHHVTMSLLLCKFPWRTTGRSTVWGGGMDWVLPCQPTIGEGFLHPLWGALRPECGRYHRLRNFQPEHKSFQVVSNSSVFKNKAKIITPPGSFPWSQLQQLASPAPPTSIPFYTCYSLFGVVHRLLPVFCYLQRPLSQQKPRVLPSAWPPGMRTAFPSLLTTRWARVSRWSKAGHGGHTC